jgi:D-3-phosphoglycerate dehydrogenase
MPRVLVSDPIAQAGIEHMRKVADVDVKLGLSKEELITVIGDYDALAVRSETKVTAEVLAAAHKLRIIGRAGVGVDNIDVKAATERGIVVVNSPEGNTIAAAELTFALILALTRNIPQADATMRAGRWDRKKFTGTELYGKTLGVIGLGKIGGEVARRARAFEMKVLAYDPFATEEKARGYGAELVPLEDIYKNSDIISLHVPLNDQTRGMIAEPQFAIMKNGVRIINCARGGIIDETALANAVKSGKAAGAAVDVYTKEPAEPHNPLLGIENIITTPHLGASTEEAQINVAIDISEQIADVLTGKPARAAVNMPALSPEALQAAQPWLQLAEKIGSLQTQLATELDGKGRPIEQIEVLFEGDFTGIPVNTVTRSVLAGMLTPVLSDPVNLVNAPVLAQQRGLKITETTTPDAGEYTSMLTVRVTTTKGQRTVSGVVFGSSDIRILKIDDFRVDLVPQGVLLTTRHTDKPGIIGAVGTLLGQNNVNIAGMQLGRETVGGTALMVVMVDNNITHQLLAQIRDIPGMEAARVVQL